MTSVTKRHVCRKHYQASTHPVDKLGSVDDSVSVAIELFHGLVGLIHVLGVHITLEQEAPAKVRRHFTAELTVEMEIQRAAAVNVEQVEERADLVDEGLRVASMRGPLMW